MEESLVIYYEYMLTGDSLVFHFKKAIERFLIEESDSFVFYFQKSVGFLFLRIF